MNVPFRRKWSLEEDEKMIELVQEFGTDWKKISSFFPERNARSCRTRYINFLQNRKPHRWTSTEDQNLIKYVTREGANWKKIHDNYFPYISENEIKVHYKQQKGLIKIAEKDSQPIKNSLNLELSPPITFKDFSTQTTSIEDPDIAQIILPFLVDQNLPPIDLEIPIPIHLLQSINNSVINGKFNSDTSKN